MKVYVVITSDIRAVKIERVGWEFGMCIEGKLLTVEVTFSKSNGFNFLQT